MNAKIGMETLKKIVVPLLLEIKNNKLNQTSLSQNFQYLYK